MYDYKEHSIEERQTGMNIKFFNGSVEDTFDLILTFLNSEKNKNEKIDSDDIFYIISIKTISKLTRESVRLQITFFKMGEQCALEFTRISGNNLEYLKKVKYYKKRFKKLIKALIKKAKRKKY